MKIQRGALAACTAVLTLAGCGAAQPVAETAARAVATQLPGSFDRLQARQDCRAHAAEAHAQADDAARMAALDGEIESYRTMVEAALMYRAETLRLVERIRATLDRRETLPGQDLAQLNAGLAEHLAQRRQLFSVAEAHECWLDAWGPGNALAPDVRLKGIMLSLSAALVLYDNYLLAISLYQEEPRLRMLLNNKDVGYDIDYGELNRMALSFASEETRSRVRRGIAYFEAEMGRTRERLATDRHLAYLDQLIAQSPSYNMTRQFSPLAAVGRKLGFYVPFTAETLLRLKDEGVNLTSMIFGNTVGLVESRHGKLYDRAEVRDGLAGDLRAGDILVERTPFRLTDSFIPGRWGHARCGSAPSPNSARWGCGTTRWCSRIRRPSAPASPSWRRCARACS